MIQVCIMGGHDGLIRPEKKVYLTLFGGCDLKRQTVARQILARRQQERDGQKHPPRQFFLTICGGVDITCPTLAEEFLDLRQMMDAGALAFEDASFDRVLAPYVISVVPDPEGVMAEIARVCRPGGTVVVVNHFRSDNRVVAGVERLLTPASRWIGFRMDLAEARVLRDSALELVERESVNLLGMWRVLTFRRTT